MVILPSSVTLQTPEKVGVRDLPEFSLRLGLTSVPLPGPVGFAAAGAGVAGATWEVCPKRSWPLPISRKSRRFTCEFSNPLPWHATQTSISNPTGAGGGVGGNGDITGACDQWAEPVLVLPLQWRSLLPEKLESVLQSSLLTPLAVHALSTQTAFHDLELKPEEVHHVLKLES